MGRVILKNVSKTFDNNVKAVVNASLTAEDKEFVVLVGPSGCGKTTTLRMIAGLEEVSEGEIFIGDRKVNGVLPKDRDIAMVFQNYALYPHMTAYDNMAFALKLRKIRNSQIKERVHQAANLLGIEQLLDRKPKQLSGGQRQRVALGRAIVRNPQVFLFDEPLSNLDAKLRVQMRSEIIKLHKKLQTTIIYVTHDQVEAMTMGDKIIVMKDGIIHQNDNPLNIYNHPANKFVAGFIGSPAINFFEGRICKDKHNLIFDEGKFQVKIPEKYADDLDSYIDKDITMGIRPEDIYDKRYSGEVDMSKGSASGGKAEISALVEVVEPMGNEFIVYLHTGKSPITARFAPKQMPELDKNLEIIFDMNKAHFFDNDTEKCLI